jgi:hypothetical protein
MPEALGLIPSTAKVNKIRSELLVPKKGGYRAKHSNHSSTCLLVLRQYCFSPEKNNTQKAHTGDHRVLGQPPTHFSLAFFFLIKLHLFYLAYFNFRTGATPQLSPWAFTLRMNVAVITIQRKNLSPPWSDG